MLFRDTIQEYEFDCCSRKMAPRAVGGYIKMLGYLADYLEQNHKIIELEEIKGIHIKKFLMEKEKLGRKPSYINDLSASGTRLKSTKIAVTISRLFRGSFSTVLRV